MPAVSVAVAGLATTLALVGFGLLRWAGLWQGGDDVLVPLAVAGCVVSATAAAVAAVRAVSGSGSGTADAGRLATTAAVVAAACTVPAVLLATTWAATDGSQAPVTRSAGLVAAVAAVAVGRAAWWGRRTGTPADAGANKSQFMRRTFHYLGRHR
jgi:hypothetical protein